MKPLPIFLMFLSTVGFSQSKSPKKSPPPPKSAPAPAKPASAPTKWPIESLSVEGNRSFTREQVLAIAGLKPGQVAGRSDFDAARDRLVASGAFETVSCKFVPGN